MRLEIAQVVVGLAQLASIPTVWADVVALVFPGVLEQPTRPETAAIATIADAVPVTSILME